MDRNNIIAFALSMIVFAAYLTYQDHRRGELEAAQAAARAQAAATAIAESEAAGSTASVAATGNETATGANVPAAPAQAGSGAGSIADSPGSAAVPPGPGAGSGGATPDSAAAVAREIPLVVHTLENGDVRARISNAPAMIEGWQLLHYSERLPAGEVPMDLVDPKQPVLATVLDGIPGSFAKTRFEVIHAGPREIVQQAQNASGRLMRTLRLDASGYGFDLELAFDSGVAEPLDARFEILWPARTSTRADFGELTLLAYGVEEGVTRSLVPGIGQPGFLGFGGSPDGKERVEGGAQWAGFDVPYFTGIILDAEARDRLSVVFEALEPTISAQARVTLPSVAVGPAGSMQENLRGFFGPKDPDSLAAVAASLGHSVNRGWSWLEPLTRFFELALDWLYGFIPNYGIAIIVLTILVRIVTAPLMVNQMRSAERMRAVQPKIQALQERHKNDRQRLAEEQMKLFREEGINPLGGCLPLLLQFPVLIGLFYALRSSIGLRHAPFFSWIDDLSQPDLLFALPGVDFPIRLLPLLMGASMYVQQKMTPMTGMDPVQARMMVIMMPAMMLLISYTFPSGLVLYWTVSNVLGIAHQYWLRRQTQAAAPVQS